jgi:ketosteroid isomerase-like protein
MSMKIAYAFVAVLALASAGCAKKVDVTAAKTALQTADADWSASVATGADAFAGFVASDGVIMPPNEPAVSGAAAAKDWASKMTSMPGFGVTWAANVVEVAASGDVGYTSGAYDLHANAPDGSTFSDHGKYLTVWKKDAAGAWKVAYDMFNSDVPVMAAAPADTTKAAPAK